MPHDNDSAAWIGRPMPRLEDRAFLTGDAAFTGDVSLPGEAQAVVVRSPHAHADIRGIDAAAALEADGVLGVWTAGDLKAAGIAPLPSGTPVSALPEGNSDVTVADAPQYPLADGRVRYVGEAVALVVAETLAAAVEAADLVEVDYAERPAVTTPEAARADGAPQLWDDIPGNVSIRWDGGDVAATDAAFEAAARVVETEMEFPREVVAFMEPRGAIGEWHPESGGYTLHAGCQSGHAVRGVLAPVMGIEAGDLRVVVPKTGGGFGARNITYPEFPLVLFAAKVLGRPVKWIASRSEAFLTDSQARSQKMRAAMAFDGEGRATGLRLAVDWWHGGYLINNSIQVIVVWMSPMVCGPYRIPAHHFAIEGIFTNTAPLAAFRGIARAEAAYALERLMDHAAADLGLDPVELRRRNLIAREEMPWTSATGAVYQPTDFAGNMDRGLAALDWDGFDARAADAAARGRVRGRAVTTYLENAGGALSEYAELSFGDDPAAIAAAREGDGRLQVLVGTQDFGMGHATVFAQVMADVLGVAPDRIDVIDGDTGRVREGYGAHGSRCMRIGGGTVHKGAISLIEAGKEIAGDLLEASVADLDYRDGGWTVTGTDRRVGLFEVGAEAARRGTPLVVEERFTVPGASYPAGCHVAEVEIDPATGQVWLDRYAVISDPGRVINPLLAAGQLHGGIAQGVGQALLERVAYDPESGQLLSGSFMDHCMPRADDLPEIVTDFNPDFDTIEGDDNPLGVKGIGEGPTTASPPTVVNAVLDAVARHTGRRPAKLDMPLTPEVVWRAMAGSGTNG